MIPFTHEHGFETPGLYTCNVMHQKLLGSADQSLPHKDILLTGNSLCCYM